MERPRALSRGLACLVLVALAGCDGGGPVGPTTPTTLPPAPSMAVVTLKTSDAIFKVTSYSNRPAGRLDCGDARIRWIFVESAGVAARVTYSDTYLLTFDGVVQELRTGGPRNDAIPAGGSVEIESTCGICGYEGTDVPYTYYGNFQITDAMGHVSTVSAKARLVKR